MQNYHILFLYKIMFSFLAQFHNIIQTRDLQRFTVCCKWFYIMSTLILRLFLSRTERPTLTYCALLEKTISETNILIFKTFFIVGVSFVASVINFTRVTDFEEEQLCLETILLTVVCYLTTFDATKSTALLLGGLFHWFLAFKTRNKDLTVFIMTCLQAISQGLRYYEWTTMVEHIFISCVAIHFTAILKTHYVYILLYSFSAAYFSFVVNYGIYLEDFFLLLIVVFAAAFATTGDTQHCYLQGNLSLLTVWVLLKEIRIATSYSGLGFLLL